MQLNQPNLQDRSFLIQYNDVLDEFGNVIPRLKNSKNLKYITDAESFEQQLMLNLGLGVNDSFDSHILTTSDSTKEYIGGLWSFSKSPENFDSNVNDNIKIDLDNSSYGYITCLQVRDVLRGSNKGSHLFSEAMKSILNRFDKVRGVVSEKNLLPYYVRFGAEIQTPLDASEDLSIITFSRNTFSEI